MAFTASIVPHAPEWACIQLQAPQSSARVPVHLCVLVDASLSMDSDEKLANVKRSLHVLVEQLGPQDQLTIITFSDRATALLSAADVVEKAALHERIALIQTEGSTNLAAAIAVSMDSLHTGFARKQGILLLTDGHANSGIVTQSGILHLVGIVTTKFHGTSISCIGYGTDHNGPLLKEISKEGGGAYYVVTRLDQVAEVFGDVLGGLMSCAYQQATVILPLSVKVRSAYPVRTLHANQEILLGDLASEGKAVILAQLPVGHPITMKTFHRGMMTSMMLECKVLRGPNADEANAHYLRADLVTLMEDLTKNPTEAQRSKIAAYRVLLTEFHEKAADKTLWDLLLTELHYCGTRLEEALTHGISREDWEQTMTQRTACMGLMRGISSQSNDVPGYRFSNETQRNISSQFQDSVEEPGAPQRAVFRQMLASCSRLASRSSPVPQ